MATDHRYNLTGVITAPVRSDNGAVVGLASITPDGKIEAQLHPEMMIEVIRQGLILNLADGITVGLHLIPAKENQDGTY